MKWKGWFSRDSLAGCLFRYVFGLYFAVTLIVTVVQLTVEYQKAKEDVQRDVSSVSYTFRPGLEKALWSYNMPLLESIVQGIVQVNTIEGVQVWDESGHLIHTQGMVAGEQDLDVAESPVLLSAEASTVEGEWGQSAASTTSFSDKLFWLRFPVNYISPDSQEVVPMGQVVIYSSNAVVFDRVSYGFFLILINSVIKTAALWLIFFFFVRRLLARPLGELTRSVDQIRLDTPESPAPVRLSAKSAELKTLERAFNRMIDRNRSLLNDLSEKEQELRDREIDEAAQKARNQFVAAMSHEIRTPMNAIVGLTGLAMKTDLTIRQQDYLQKIDQSANALLRIINDVLDFSKMEAGQMTIENTAFDLNEVLDNIAVLVSGSCDEKGLEFIFSVSPDIPGRLIGDPLRLGQVLLNFCSNAVKFTEQGHVLVGVEVASRCDQTGALQLKFYVEDSGIGISTEQKTRLFKPFSQADESITRKYGGTGLGLVICQHLIDLMGGDINVSSAPGRGSIFSFDLSFGLPETLPEQDGVLDDALKNVKVLLVDDHQITRSILVNLLNAAGAITHVARDGYEAIEKVEYSLNADPYELVLMDWKMPGLDGITAASRIKGMYPDWASPAILIVTAYGREEVRDKASKAGIDGFLIKPITPAVLFRTIQAVRSAHGDADQNMIIPQSLESSSLSGDLASHDACFFPEFSGKVPVHTPGNKHNLVRFRGRRVLVVEDHPVNQQIVRELLELEGICVVEASHGQEALDLFQAHGDGYFDLILMDLQMPVMDGYSAVSAIRTMGHYGAGVPIIAMTAHVLKEEREQCIAVGMNDHIGKPVEPELLFRILIQYLNKVAVHGDEYDVCSVNDMASEGDCSAETDDLLPDYLPGLNISEGLERVGHSTQVYLKVLKTFSGHHSLFAEKSRIAWEKRDIGQLKYLVHNLKGGAGNIGANRVFELSRDIEQELKKSNLRIWRDSCSYLCEALDEVFSAINELEVKYSVNSGNRSGVTGFDTMSTLWDSSDSLSGPRLSDCSSDSEEIMQLSEQLEELLESDIAASRQVLEKLDNAMPDLPLIRQLKDALVEYDTALAMSILQQIKTEIAELQKDVH